MSILVAKHINAVLSGDEQLSQAVGDRIYLEGIKNETEFPYIIFDYDVSPDSENSTKDGDSDVCCLTRTVTMVLSRLTIRCSTATRVISMTVFI